MQSHHKTKGSPGISVSKILRQLNLNLHKNLVNASFLIDNLAKTFYQITLILALENCTDRNHYISVGIIFISPLLFPFIYFFAINYYINSINRV